MSPPIIKPPAGGLTRGFTQPVFISRHSYRGRRVRSVSRGLALLAGLWTVGVVVGSMAFLLTRDSRASFVDLPLHRADCPGAVTAGPWRVGGAHGQTGNRWTISVYAEHPLAAAQASAPCATAAALLPALTTSGRPGVRPAGLRCQTAARDRLVVQQSGCVSGTGAARQGFSWYPALGA